MDHLYIAAIAGDLEIADALINAGANLDLRCNYDRTALHAASISEHVEIVKSLIYAGADLDIKDDSGSTPLDYAIRFGIKKVANVLREAADYQNPIKEPDLY